MHHSQEVTQMIFISDNQSAKVLKPGKQPLYFPSSFVASQRSAVLRRRFSPIHFVRSDHLHVSLVGQLFIQFVRVIRLVANDFLRQLFQHASVQSVVHQRHFMRASAACVHGERNTFSVDNAHDFSTFSAFGLANSIAPFFAGAKVPSMNPSLRSMPPRSRRSWARAMRTPSKTPSRDHFWKCRWQVLFVGYLSGKSFHGAPVRRIHKMPLSTLRGSTDGRPCRPGPLRGDGRYWEIRFHCSSVISITKCSHNSYESAN